MTIKTDKVKEAFARRLHEAMDKKGYPMRGRARVLSKEFGISDKGAGKWLNGEAIPETSKIPVLASFLNVNAEWLLNGNNATATIDTNSLQLKKFNQILNKLNKLFIEGKITKELIENIDEAASLNAKLILDNWIKSQPSPDDDAKKTA